MKDTEEKRRRIFRRGKLKAYEEFINDGREYSEDNNLRSLNLFLQTSKYGVVIAGQSGTGKTALVRQFANQELNKVFKINSVKVIKIKEGYLNETKDIDQILEFISNLILENQADALILYVKAESVEMLKAIQNIAESYFCDIVKFYDLKALKVIVEITADCEKEMDKVYNNISSEFCFIFCEMPRNVNAVIQKLMPRIDELSVNYSVGYSMDVLKYYYIFAHSEKDKNNTITRTFLDVLEKAFIISKKNGSDTLQKTVTRYINEDKFEKIKNLSTYRRQATAYHEAGHALLALASGNEKIAFISIIPGKFYMGICSQDNNELANSRVKNREFYLNQIAISLAGRMSEAIFDEKLSTSSGSASDLKDSMESINYMFFKLGLSKSLGKNYILLDEESMSEALTVRVEAEKREILNEAEQLVKVKLLEHREFLLILSQKLTDDYYICGDDLYKMWDDYLKTKEEAE